MYRIAPARLTAIENTLAPRRITCSGSSTTSQTTTWRDSKRMARYMGADRAEEFGRRNGVPGELVVRVRPTKVIAGFDIAE
jgi:hypothetical protein